MVKVGITLEGQGLAFQAADPLEVHRQQVSQRKTGRWPERR
jgi:hypothetical protein